MLSQSSHELVSPLYGDRYASSAGALAQADEVFLKGCGLTHRWAGRRRFTVAELGFGTGRNMLATIARWAERTGAEGSLHLFSIEAHPLPKDTAKRLIEAEPELARWAPPLMAAWPADPGRHRIEWPKLKVVLDVAIGPADAMLAGWQGSADAWFLDGFAPQRNPAMWDEALLALVTERSRPGARAASWCVAGEVRRRLEALGWKVERRPGLPPKRHRLEARLTGNASDPSEPQQVAIIGAGVAGLATARALAALGLSPVVHAGPPGASTAPRIVLAPLPGKALADDAFRRALALIASDCPRAIEARGVLRLARHAGEARRLKARAGKGATWLEGNEAARRLGEEGQAMIHGGLWLSEALIVRPAALLDAWQPPTPPRGPVVGLSPAAGGGWWLATAEDRMRYDAVVLAGGWQGRTLWPLDGLAPEAGYLFLDAPLGETASSGGHIVAPGADTLVWGGTHHGAHPPPADEARAGACARLGALRPWLAARLAQTSGSAWQSVRARRPGGPFAGRLAPGLWALTGLGGRGFLWAPLLAEHVAADIAGVPSPLHHLQS